jgi:hypothetical protein
VALIAFAMAKNSAGAERSFSLLKTLFRNSQGTAFADYIRGSICSATTTPSALVRLASEYVYLRREIFKGRIKRKKRNQKWPENGRNGWEEKACARTPSRISHEK